MPDQRAPRPVRPRVDDTAADTGTLVDMGVLPEQPEPPAPEPPPEPEPETPEPEPEPETPPGEPPPNEPA
jgi:hypothetical protein